MIVHKNREQKIFPFFKFQRNSIAEGRRKKEEGGRRKEEGRRKNLALSEF
ncbi:MAG: hypothetical protein F6K17_41795 [Okeania sp. SIO3C4]|nr:hypothetical protein [Okeania sp. SIO3B3]NER08604.1 hypothetical protein [Okeania sp. SIO3C4]